LRFFYASLFISCFDVVARAMYFARHLRRTICYELLSNSKIEYR
jgi:hypothetical protein